MRTGCAARASLPTRRATQSPTSAATANPSTSVTDAIVVTANPSAVANLTVSPSISAQRRDRRDHNPDRECKKRPGQRNKQRNEWAVSTTASPTVSAINTALGGAGGNATGGAGGYAMAAGDAATSTATSMSSGGSTSCRENLTLGTHTVGQLGVDSGRSLGARN